MKGIDSWPPFPLAYYYQSCSAKSIQNKPEALAKLTKKAVLQEFEARMARMRKEVTLLSSSVSGGVYLLSATTS